jgi:hypothetical protein
MSTPPQITPPSLDVPVINPATGKFTKEWGPVIVALIKKLNGL